MAISALFLSVGALCLAGYSFFFVLSRRSFLSSKKFSERLQDLQDWQNRLQLEWDNTYGKLRSMAARLSRLQQKLPGESAPVLDVSTPPNPDGGWTLEKIHQAIAARRNG